MALREERRAFESGDLSFNFVERANAVPSDDADGSSLSAKLEATMSQNRPVHQGQRTLLSWVLKVKLPHLNVK